MYATRCHFPFKSAYQQDADNANSRATTNDSIASIATCVGYETQGKFTKAFKDVALQLPTEYRKIHRHDR